MITAALASGQYVEVVINGKTYTSEPGGAVVVDPAHNTGMYSCRIPMR